MAQTWHQVRPGEVRDDCGGCHAHSQQPLAFDSTAAAQPGYPVVDLTHDDAAADARRAAATRRCARRTAGVVNVEFYRDIRPLLQRSCVALPHAERPDAARQSRARRLRDSTAACPATTRASPTTATRRWGYPPVIANRTLAADQREPLRARVPEPPQPARSGRSSARASTAGPTPTIRPRSVPGDAATLPPGAEPNEADLDYTGTIMPPPGSGVPPLSDDEKMTFARWIDLGCPINFGDGGDDARTAGSSTTCARRSTSACRGRARNAGAARRDPRRRRRRAQRRRAGHRSRSRADFAVAGRAAGRRARRPRRRLPATASSRSRSIPPSRRKASATCSHR